MEKYFDVNADKVSIRCKIYANDTRNINHVVLSSHGFGGNKDNNASKKLAEDLLSRYDDVAVITFDWPCHGNDVRKKLDLTDCDTYLTTMLDYIRNVMGVEDIYSQATSFGGYLVLKYISEHGNPFTKVALRCPAVNMYNAMVERILTKEQLMDLARRKDVDSGFERKVRITNDFLLQLKQNNILERDFIDFADDILIMHGTQDELIDFNVDKAFCENNVIEFIPIEGADHRYQNPARLRECINYIGTFYKDDLEKKTKNV